MSLTIYYTTIVRSWKIIMWEASSSSASLLTLKRTHAMPDKGNKVETSTLTAIPFDDIETTRETHLFDRERKREKWLFILLRLRLQLHLWITMDHHHQQLTHQWITQTATTLPPTVAQQLSNVNWKRRRRKKNWSRRRRILWKWFSIYSENDDLHGRNANHTAAPEVV